MSYDTFRERVQTELVLADIPPHAITSAELRAAYREGYSPRETAKSFIAYYRPPVLRDYYSDTID